MMKWGAMIKKWFGQQKREQNDLFSNMLDYSLTEDDHPEPVEMLKEKGLQCIERKEVLIAVNILNCDIFGDLETEVEKMVAFETLHRFGFEGIEQFQSELDLFRKRNATHPC